MSRYEKKPDESGYCFSYSFINSSTRSNARMMSAFALLPLISPRFKASKDAIISLYCLFASSSNLSHFILSPLYSNIIRPKKSENNRPESNRAQCSKVAICGYILFFRCIIRKIQRLFRAFSNIRRTPPCCH